MTTKTTEITRLQARSLDVPDETRPMGGKGRLEVVQIGETMLVRATFQPGFRWSEHVKPLAGTDLCQVRHVGYVVSGRAAIRMADGTERELAAGDAFDVPPGHDSWVIGDEPYVSLDFSAAERSGLGSAGEHTSPPKGHRILLENERVRVLEACIRPGETTGMHSHPPCVVYALGSARVKLSFQDGTSREAEIRDGDTSWSEGGWHDVENIGTTDDIGIIVELKE